MTALVLPLLVQSAATQAGVALLSATTSTSVGPASESIATSPKP